MIAFGVAFMKELPAIGVLWVNTRMRALGIPKCVPARKAQNQGCLIYSNEGVTSHEVAMIAEVA